MKIEKKSIMKKILTALLIFAIVTVTLPAFGGGGLVCAWEYDPLFSDSVIDNQTFDIKDLPSTVRGKGTFSFTIDTSKYATWSSSNEKVASVTSFNNGKEGCLCIKSIGQTRIEATNWNGSKLSAYINVKGPDEDISQGESGETKYSYELYKIKDLDLYGTVSYISPYEEKFGDPKKTNTYSKYAWIMVITDNPRNESTRYGEELTFRLCDADTKKEYASSGLSIYFSDDFTPEYYCPARPSELREATIADIDNIPDMTSDGRYIYFMRTEFKGSGKKQIKVSERVKGYLTSGIYEDAVYTDDTWTVDIKDPAEGYLEWIRDAISKYSNDGQNVHEKMVSITEALKAKATYDNNTTWSEYNHHTSMRLDSTPYYISYFWDSSNVAPMKDIGALLGYKLLYWHEAGKSYSLHACSFGDFEGAEKRYSICPASSTSPALYEYCPQLTLADFEEISKEQNSGLNLVSARGKIASLANLPASETVPVESVKIKDEGTNVAWVMPQNADESRFRETIYEAEVLPDNATNKKVIWTCDDPEIACPVSTGDNTCKIIGLKPGLTNIRARTEDGGFTDVRICYVAIAGERIVMQKELTVGRGQTAVLSMKVEPSDSEDSVSLDYKYDTSIVKARRTYSSNGAFNYEVTGLENGTADLTFRLSVNRGVTETCTVNVVDPVPVSSITLNVDKTEQKKGTTLQLVPTVKPDNATLKDVIWESSDIDAADVDQNGLVTFGNAGSTATITATARDGSGVSASCEITVHRHEFEYVKRQPETCDEDGVSDYWKCNKCGDLYADQNQRHPLNKPLVRKKKGHLWGPWKRVSDSCSAAENGEVRVCLYDSSHKEYRDAPERHVWNSSEAADIPASCGAEGMESIHCIYCGEQKSGSGKAINKLEHTFDQSITDDKYLKTAADCTHPAVYYISCCCGEAGKETFEYGEALGHQWDKGTVTKEATCEDDGLMLYKCTRNGCGEERTQTIGKLQHAYSAEWTTDDDYHWHACTEDKCSSIDAYGAHVWAEKITTQPTCTAKGEKSYFCPVCGKAKNTEAAALGHKPVKHDAADATCNSEGNAEYWSCGRCGKFFSDAAGNAEIEKNSWVVPRTAHKFSAWTEAVAATELAGGQESRTCSVCRTTETRATAKLAPTLKAVKIAKPKAAKKSVTVKWKKIGKKDLKKIKKVQIQVSTDKTFTANVKTSTASARKTSVNVKGLAKGRKYYVHIRAITGNHVSAWSDLKSVTVK